MNLCEPNYLLERWYKKIPKECKTGFIAAIIWSLIAHMYIMVNNYPNHDGIAYTKGFSSFLSFGRWFLQYVCMWNGVYSSLNWITLVMAIIMLGLAAAVIVNLYKINNNLWIILVTGIVVTFPSVTSTFSYTFLADGLMMGFFLAILAVKLADSKRKFSLLLGGMALALAMGIYQVNVAVSVTAIVTLLIYKIVSGIYKDIRQFLDDIKRYFSIGVLGIVIYFIVLNIMLDVYNTQLIEYQGIGNLGGMSFSYYLNNLVLTYKYFIEFFQTPVIARNMYVILITFVGLASIIVFLFEFISNKSIKVWEKILIVILVLLLPIAVNLVTITSNEIYYHMVMKHDYCFIYILPIIIMNGLSVRYNKDLKINSKLNRGLIKFKYVILAITAIMTVNFVVIANIGYWSLEVKNQRVYAFMNRVVYSIENFEEFNYDIPVYFIGSEKNQYYLNTKMSDKEIEGLIGLDNSTLIYGFKKFSDYAEDYLGVFFKRTSTQQREEIDASGEVEKMPSYPEKGSIKIINGVLVVKS